MKNCPEIIHSHCVNKDKLCETCYRFKKFVNKPIETKTNTTPIQEGKEK